MAKSKQYNKKPGIKDIVKVVSSLIQELRIAQERILELYGALDMYIEFKGDAIQFKSHIDEKLKEIKENEQKANDKSDGEDTDGDKQDKGVVAEGIRA